jgi:hypothetical protein
MARRHLIALSLLSLLILVSSKGRLWSQGTGGHTASYLRAIVIPEEIARGGAYTPFSPTSLSLFTNAAALPLMERPSVAVGYSHLPFGQHYSMLSLATEVGEFGGVGLGLLNYGIGDLPARDASGVQHGTTGNRELAFLIGGGMQIGPGSIGATFSYLREDFTGNSAASANGYAIDLSGTLTFRNQLFLAFSMASVAGEMRATGSRIRWAVPWQTRLSATYLHSLDDVVETLRTDPSGLPREHRKLPAAYILGIVEARASQTDSASVSLAVEAVPLRSVPVGLRVGWNSLGDLSGGFQVGIPTEFTRDLRINLAVRRDFELGDLSYHVSLIAGW